MNNNIFDTIIIGTGPAGYTASIYAGRREMKSLLIGKDPGGQIMWAREIENIPGFKSITNFEFIERMEEQVKRLGIDIIYNQVITIDKTDSLFSVKTADNEYLGKTIIIAMGLSPKKLDLPKEDELIGKGIAYCANCDGPIFKNKIVTVAGGGNAALDAAEFLAKIASQVYLINNTKLFNGFETLIKAVAGKSNIKTYLNFKINKLIGDNKLAKIIIADNETGKEEEIITDGLFVEIGRIPKTEIIAGLVKRDDRGQIIVDEKCQTSHQGIFAAGDVTNSPYKQITIACGQGTIAALSAYQYLQLQNKT